MRRLANIKGNIPALAEYDTVVLGGSIYIGQVQKALTAYIGCHRQELLGKKVGLFLCGGITDPKPQQQELQNAFPPELLAHAVSKGILGYRFDFQKMNPLEKWMVGMMGKIRESKTVFFEDEIAQFVHRLKMETGVQTGGPQKRL